MQYHIQTAPVWEAYKESGCPLCRIFGAKEKRLVKSYLNENVMDPDFRVRSNGKGFCERHIKMMYAGENKLGIALQLETRAAYIADELLKAPPKDKKAAKKTADLMNVHYGCVICDELDEFEPRYFMSIAQMYANEPEFPALFAAATHCYKHAASLIAAAEYAGKQLQQYTADIMTGLKRDLKRAEAELRRFADCFDHKSTDRPDPDTITRAAYTLMSVELKK